METEGSEVLVKLKEIMPVLEKNFAVRRIGLFGSLAGNNQSESSDIDLLVEFRKPIGWGFFSLEIFLQSIFVRKIDLTTLGGLREEMKSQILEKVIYA